MVEIREDQGDDLTQELGVAEAPMGLVDPVVMAAATVLRLQTIVSRELAASEAAVVTVGALQA